MKQTTVNTYFVPITFKLVVERYLFSGLHFIKCKNTDAQAAVHRPLLRFTIWFAAVVDETRDISFVSGIDDLNNQIFTLIRVVQFMQTNWPPIIGLGLVHSRFAAVCCREPVWLEIKEYIILTANTKQ